MVILVSIFHIPFKLYPLLLLHIMFVIILLKQLYSFLLRKEIYSMKMSDIKDEKGHCSCNGTLNCCYGGQHLIVGECPYYPESKKESNIEDKNP